MSKVMVRIVAFVVAFALLIGPMSAFVSDSKVIPGVVVQNTPGTEDVIESLPTPVGESPAQDNVCIKDPVTVMVLCTNPSKVAQALSGIPYRGFLSQRGNGEIISPVLQIPRYALEILKGTEGVLAILDYGEMLKSSAADGEYISPGVSDQDGISSIFDTKQHYGSEAWSKGFTGQGVNVAVTQLGIDFSQPDIMDTQARVTNPASPYYGWPMVFDSNSLTKYISSGGNTTSTWFVNTSAECELNYTEIYDMIINTEAEWGALSSYTNYWQPKSFGNAESFTLDGFTPGKPYVFAIRAEDEAGNLGPISNSQTATAMDDNTPPSRITNLAVVPGQDHGTVSMSWTAPGDDGAVGSATSYLIRYSNLPIANIHCFRHLSYDIENFIVPAVSGTVENHIAVDLEAGKLLYFAIVAVDEAGNWAPVSNYVSTTVTIDTMKPETITGLTATPVGANHTGVILNWTAPHDEGATGSSCVRYEGKYSENPIVTENDWDLSTSVPESMLPVPGTPGTPQTAHVVIGTLPSSNMVPVVNESVYGPALGNGTEVGPWFLNYTGVASGDVDIYRQYYWNSEWCTQPLQQGTDYTFTSPASEINLLGWETQLQVFNETLYGPAIGGGDPIDMGPWALDHGQNYNDLQIYLEDSTGWTLLVETVDFDILDGFVFLYPSFEAGAFTYAFYNTTDTNPSTYYQEVVYGPTSGAELGPWPLDHVMVQDLQVIVLDSFGWTGTTDYTYDGWNITFNSFPEAGAYIYARYNYSNPGLRADDSILAYYNYSVMNPLYFALRGVDELGRLGDTVSVSSQVAIDMTVPGQITDLSVETGILHGMVFMNFTAMGDDGVSGYAKRYIVKYSATPITNDGEFNAATEWIYADPEYIGSNSQLKWNWPKAPGQSESYQFGYLPGWNYFSLTNPTYFAVKVKDEAGNLGPLSNCPSVVATNDVIQPATITDLTAQAGAIHGSVMLSWTAVGDDGSTGQLYGDPPYTIKWSTSDIDTTPKFDAAPGTTLDITKVPGQKEYLNISGLVAGQLYYFSVRARDDATLLGDLPVSASFIATNDATAPGAITLVTATGDQNGQVKLNFNAPGNNGNTGKASGYQVRFREYIPEGRFIQYGFDQIGILNISYIPHYYNVTGIASQSGLYRMGMHIDQNVATYVNGNKTMGLVNYSSVLLVDSTTDYVYNTVYVDLDNDRDFSDEKACTKGDETSYRDMDGDGFADVSGGMIYFIGSATPVHNEALTVLGGGTYALASHGNVVNNSWTVYQNGNAIASDQYSVSLDSAGYMNITFSPALVSTSGVTVSYDYNGLAIPYSERYSERYGMENAIPGNGDIVAFMGEFTLDSTSGTAMASSIAGQGYLPLPADNSIRPVVGMAPDAKIIAVADAGFDGIVFALEGYDGIPMTGDEAHIISSAMSSSTVYQSGLDFTSNYMDWLATTYGGGRSSIVVTSGGNGPGYGTVTSPGTAPGVITAGLASDLYYRAIGGTYEAGPRPMFGDVVTLSGRGPTASGMPKPDVVAAGAYFGFIAQPLYMPSSGGTYPNLVELWMAGQGLTSAVASAGVALVYQAYGTTPHLEIDDSLTYTTSLNSTTVPLSHRSVTPASFRLYSNGTLVTSANYTLDAVNGVVTIDSYILQDNPVINASYVHTDSVPQGSEAHEILMSGADDLCFDIFSQGAGQINASKSVDIASNSVGVSVSPCNWVPGDFEGVQYGTFVRLVSGGTSSEHLSETFAVENHNVGLQAVTVQPEVLSKFDEVITTISTNISDPHETILLNETGFYTRDGRILQLADPSLWNDAELLKITTYNENDTGYWGELFAWTDLNGNGKADGDSTTDPYPGAVAWGERNRLQISTILTNKHEMTIHHPAERVGDGILVWIRANGGPTYDDCKWVIKAEAYKKADWDWLTVDHSTLNIPGKSYGRFTATLDKAKALAAGPGTYDGAIKVGGDDGALIPVVINVPMTSGSEIEPKTFSITSEVVDTSYNRTRTVTNETSVLKAATGQLTFYLKHDNVDLDQNDKLTKVVYNGTNVQWLELANTSYSVDAATGLVTLLLPPSSIQLDASIHTWYTYIEDERSLAHSSVIPGSLTVLKNGIVTMEYGSVDKIHVFTNRQDVVGELLINATGGETTANLANGAGPEMISGYTLYLNGTAMWDGIDYTLNTVNGQIQFEVPLRVGMVITADYYSYDPSVTHLQLAHTELSPGIRTTINPNGYRIYIDGTGVNDLVVAVNTTTGALDFTAPVPAGAVITADYKYGSYIPDYSRGAIDFLIPPALGSSIIATYKFYNSVHPYMHSYMIGGSPGTGSGKPGDWRYFYTTVGDGPLNLNANHTMAIDLSWARTGSDIDAFLFTKASLSTPSVVQNSEFALSRYGPYAMTNSGGSTESSSLFTASGGASDFALAPPAPGLNILALHNVRFNGTMDVEAVTVSLGRMAISQDSIDIITNSLVGEQTLYAYGSTGWNGMLSGIAAGPSAPEVRQDLLVYQDDPDWANFDSFEEQLASGNTSIFVTLKDCLIFNAHIYGHTDTYTREGSFNDVGDLDLGVFLDANGDGVTQTEEFYAMCADNDADEEVKLIGPPDGNYIIRPYGFTLKSVPAHYDLEITIVQGLGFTVTGEGNDTKPDNSEMWISDDPVPAYTQSSLTLGYNLQGAKNGVTLQGALFLGPGDAPYAILMAISLRYDSIAPDVLSTSPIGGTTTNSVQPTIIAEFSDTEFGDLVIPGASMTVDGVDVTSRIAASRALRDPKVKDEMYTTGTVSYTPQVPLTESIHTVVASMKDKAGNSAISAWSFTVDTSAPALTLDDAFLRPFYTNSPTISITGTTERSANLKAFGGIATHLSVRDNGEFSIEVDLDEGENDIQIYSTDGMGNVASFVCVVYYDDTAPSFVNVRFSDGFTTNKPIATMSGKASESGTISINGAVITVNSDGNFEKMISLTEGQNTIHLMLTDLAGNTAHSWQNVTLDTVAPTITLTNPASTVTFPTFVLSGNVEPGSQLFVNGKRIDVGTRQSADSFSTTLTLSEGLNTLVIESRDDAGNVAELRHIVEYDSAGGTGTNYGAIGLMVVLLIIGLILGLFIAPFFFGGRPEKEPEEEEPAVTPEGEISKEEAAEPAEEGAEPLEPIPPEESIPEETPAKSKETPAEPEDLELEEIEELAPKKAPKPVQVEDPRITKLTEAYKSGKISKELYEKNLARFREQK